MNISSITPITTPNEDVIKGQTPSPQSVHEFTNQNEFRIDDSTSKPIIRSDVVSDLISDQLVTQYVCSEVGLPSLSEEGASPSATDAESTQLQIKEQSSDSSSDTVSSSDAQNEDPWSTNPNQTTTPNIILGPERTITFHTESLGIKLSRHTDGHVRILSITPFRSSTNERIRDGELHEGDLIRQVGDVDLRRPIDSNVWKMTVGLIKLAPRPLTMVVATEYTEVEDVNDATEAIDEGGESRRVCNRCEVTGQSVLPCDSPNSRVVGSTRHVVFYQQSLGVKLQHTSRGYVVIHSLNRDMPSEARSGDLKEGDVVLQVGGVWDLYHPISINAWGILVKFIKECRRPMRMVVADREYLNCIMSPGGDSSNCSEEEDSVQSSVDYDCQLSPCSVDGKKLNRIDEEIETIEVESESKQTIDVGDESSTQTR